MDPLLYLMLAPVVFFGSWRVFQASRKTTVKKPNIPKSSDVGVLPKVEERVFPFQTSWNTVCPMCKEELKLLSHKYCSCGKSHTGHFHITCSTRNGYGCGYKWMMKAAQ